MVNPLYFVLALLCVRATSAWGGDPVSLDSLNNGQFLGRKLEIFRSPKKISIEQAIKNRDFLPAIQEVPRFGYTYDDIWAKLRVVNNRSQPKKMYFEFRGPIELLTAYLVQDGKVVSTSQGGMYMLPEYETFVSGYSYPIVEFTLPVGESTLFFSEDAVAPHFPILTYDRQGVENRIRTNTAAMSMLFGVFISFLLILVVIFIFVSSTGMLFLISGFVSFFGIIGFVSGMFRSIYATYGTLCGIPLSNYMNLYPYWPEFFSSYCLFLSLFSIAYLGKERFFATRTSRFLTVVSLVSQAALGIVARYDTVVAMNSFSVGFNVSILQAIYWSFQIYRSGKKEEIFTLVGWGIYSGFTSIQLFYFLGMANNTFFSVWGGVFGFFSLLTLVTISLVERNRKELYRTISDKKKALLKLEDNFNELRKRDEIIQIFSSPKINLEINLGLNPLDFKPRYLDTSVVFFDMRGFSKISQSLDLKDVHAIINEYVGVIIKEVQNDGGFIDKIIGDAIMAQFDSPGMCFESVKKIRIKLSELNRIRVAKNLEPVKFGTGISYGKVLAANFGSELKMDRTIIGDIVNKSSRIEAVTKIYKVDVLFDQEFKDQLPSPDFVRFVGKAKLRGRDQEVSLYEYFGHHHDQVKELKSNSASKLEKALVLAGNRDTRENAIQLINELIRECPKHTYIAHEIMDSTLVSILNFITRGSSPVGGENNG